LKYFVENMALFVIIFLMRADVFAQNNFGNADSLIQRAIRLSIIHKYETADSLLDEFVKQFPDHPAGYFFKAAVLQSRMMDYERYDQKQSFVFYLKQTIKKSDASVAHLGRKKQAEMLFFKASALSYLAFQQGKEKNYLRAIQQGIQAITLLNKIVKMDPEFYDAYLGIGTFKFWRSQLTRSLNWLPLVPDEREKGLKYVKLAITKGRYSRYAALNEIVWMLLKIHRPQEALNWAQAGLKKFPGSRFFLWGAAKSAFAVKDFSLSKKYFEQILSSLQKESIKSKYNIYICRLNLARGAIEMGNIDEAKNNLDYLENMTLEKAEKNRLKKQIQETKELKREIKQTGR